MNGVTVNRHKIKRHLCYIMLSLFFSSIISCSSGERDGEAPSADATVQEIGIEMKSAGISGASNYTEIYLKISGPDIEPAIESTTEDTASPIQFSIYVPPGEKRMFLAQARDSSKNVIFEGSLIKDIEPDMPITINIFISPGDYSISGRILLSSGVGLVGAKVTLSGSGQNIPGPVHTDCSGSGTYTFSGLYNGDYTVTSSMAGFKFDRDSINVTVKDGDVTGQGFKSVVSKIIYVDSNSDCTSNCDGSIESPYNTIQGAIDSAPPAGDTVIRVAGGGESGWYNESITIRSYITLEGGYGPDFKDRDITNKYITTIDGYNLTKGMVIFNNIHSAMIDGFTIIYGNSESEGGGIAIINSSCSIAVTHNTITSNWADSNGGGIYLASSSSVVIENNFITNNGSSTLGGGIYIIDSPSNITNNTISNNLSYGDDGCANGSGVYVKSGTIDIKNSIIWGNCFEYENTDLYVETLSAVTVTYSDIGLTNIGIEALPNSNNINNENPLFVNTAYRDYHITQDSPCKDKGTPDGAPKYDIDGEQRPYGEGFDIGADEFYPQP